MNPLFRYFIYVLVAGISRHSIAADKPYITINGTAISQTTAQMYRDRARANGVTDPEALQAQVHNEIIRRELFFQAAHKSGFDAKPDVAAEADTAYRKAIAEADAIRQAVIIRRYVEDYIAHHPVNDAQLRAIYERMRNAGTGLEYKVHHVVLKSEVDANAFFLKLKQGVRFGDAVRDSGMFSTTNEGDLGWVTPGRFIKPVADSMTRMNKNGLISRPVKAEDGFHVLQLDDTRPLKVPTFEDMRPMLETQAREQVISEVLDNLRKTAVIR